jgi:hypothetical protein
MDSLIFYMLCQWLSHRSLIHERDGRELKSCTAHKYWKGNERHKDPPILESRILHYLLKSDPTQSSENLEFGVKVFVHVIDDGLQESVGRKTKILMIKSKFGGF